jgi:predicted component of viral defense system (DUF524 family)
MNRYSAIALRLENSAAWWVLSTPGCPEALDPDDAAFPEIRPGVKAHGAGTSAVERAPIELAESADGVLIRLLETRRYEWEVIGAEDPEVSSTLEALPRKQWSKRRVKTLSGAFTAVNHLGMADFRITTGGREYRFALEITSTKLEYHTEFRQITEEIAGFCQQLLLNWDGATSLKFTSDPEEAARLTLERFIFLRSHLPPERLEELLEAIQRRPNSRLVREAVWSPTSAAGSRDWVQNPAVMARDWQRLANGGRPIPGQVLDVRKEDSVDTPANRFLKFALTEFRDLSREVLEKHPGALSLAQEARELAACLDAVLARPFFLQPGPLTRLPLDNPTLQRRDGYREILRAWLLTQAASMLAWDQHEETYGGPTRNVATLYEYWVFLQIHKILDEMKGVTRDADNPRPADDADPFLEMKDGELHIHLKRGKKTCAPFTITLPSGVVLRLHLYYERTFQMQRGATEPSSYSRQFKPDYTLAIFPARFQNEQEASEEGKIAYVHFDAKYRAESMKMIFGDLLKDEELDAEKDEGKASSTYQRGDLLKMHTYNDAVRQTAGSYVLYPGSDTETKLNKFHEIVPGVGAFVLKPGKDEYREELKTFLLSVFLHQSDQFTQYRHFSDVIHATVQEAPAVYGGMPTWRPGATCVLAYLKPEVRDLCREKRLVYSRALKDDEERSPIRIQVGNLAGAVLCPYEGGRSAAKKTLPWLAPIMSCEMLSRGQLCRVLRAEGWPDGLMPKSASAYLLFRLGHYSGASRRVVTNLTPSGSYQVVSRTLSELDACPPEVESACPLLPRL